ncbi:MAG: rhomboid family intramembrane serine protease [Desulfobacteraceae bacterium]|nr:rhomboid family intramembrane serine protease [Desulfobacteraceae bacterium]
MTNNKTHTSFFTPAIVLKTMIFINIFMFIVSLIFSGKGIDLNFHPLRFLSPSWKALKFLGASGTEPIIQLQTWWSLITANWLHGGILHIFINMMALRSVGPLIAEEFGTCRMFSIYTIGGIIGFIFSFYGNIQMTIGASSGLCGLVGAALFFGKSRGGQWGYLVYKEMAISVFILGVIGFLVPTINNWSHIGGLVGGILFAWILGYNEKRKENLFDQVLAVFFAGITIYLLAKSVISGFILINT